MNLDDSVIGKRISYAANPVEIQVGIRHPERNAHYAVGVNLRLIRRPVRVIADYNSPQNILFKDELTKFSNSVLPFPQS